MRGIRRNSSRVERMAWQREKARANALKEEREKDIAARRRERVVYGFKKWIKRCDVKIRVKKIMIGMAEEGNNDGEVRRLNAELGTLKEERRKVWNELRAYTKSPMNRGKF